MLPSAVIHHRALGLQSMEPRSTVYDAERVADGPGVSDPVGLPSSVCGNIGEVSGRISSQRSLSPFLLHVSGSKREKHPLRSER